MNSSFKQTVTITLFISSIAATTSLQANQFGLDKNASINGNISQASIDNNTHSFPNTLDKNLIIFGNNSQSSTANFVKTNYFSNALDKNAILTGNSSQKRISAAIHKTKDGKC